MEPVDSKLPPSPSEGGKKTEADSSDKGEGFFARILNFENPDLQFRFLAIMLGAIALTALCLVVWRATGTGARASHPSQDAEETYVGLEPDVPPVMEAVPTAAPRVVPPAPRPKKAAPGRQWVERADSAKTAPVTAAVSTTAPPPIRPAAPKEYVPGDASEFLSEIKASPSPVPSNP